MLEEAAAGQVIREHRTLPSVSQLLDICEVDGAPHDILVPVIREVLAEARAELSAGRSTTRLELVSAVRQRVRSTVMPWPRRVINATGVVLHTNLGRSALSEDARRAMLEAAAYSDLEMDLETGERGRRDTHIEKLLVMLTGAEAATLVNNNAGALVLALSALARGREVVVSRGQAVEIGGRFRIPDVCAQSGATLHEVGTTNRTYLSDYEAACTERTALLLRVHLSNFHMSGFVAEAGLADLARLGQERGIPVLDDLGSGCLVPTESFGLRHEPTVQESVQAGADVVVFSGDKLLGGPQAGLIVGRRDLVDRLRRHPLARALRCDKATLAAMHATLLHYVHGDALAMIPTLRMLSRARADVWDTAARWRDTLGLPGLEVEDASSAVGGGSLPGSELPSAVLAVDPTRHGISADELAGRLRQAGTPVVGRVERDRLRLDPRTVQPDEEVALLDTLRRALAR